MGAARRFVDLHAHSTASDGTTAPAEVVRLADQAELAGLALTDHDTTAGLPAARAAAAHCPRMRLIPGIEVSAKFASGPLHILGLAIDENAPALRRLGEQLRQARNQRAPEMLAKLRRLGVMITMKDVMDQVEWTAETDEVVVGRMHFARAMVHRGGVADTGPAYVDKERIVPADVIRAIRDAGGVAVLAHPGHLGFGNRAQLERIVRSLVRQGLDGIEVYHPEHTAEATRMFLDLALRLKLTITGGSDFHGSAKPHVALGQPRVPRSVITGKLAELLAETQ